MAELSMGDTLGLVGDELDDESGAKDRLRAFLLNQKWRPDQFEAWIHESLKRGSGGHVIWTRVLQDTVVAIGSHLGFEAEFGCYEDSRTDEVTFDGLWRRATGEVMLIEVAASATLVTREDGLGESLRRCAELRRAVESAAFGLCVVGNADAHLLVEAIKGNQQHEWLRVITIKDLIGLWRLRIDLEAMIGRLLGPGSNLLFSLL